MESNINFFSFPININNLKVNEYNQNKFEDLKDKIEIKNSRIETSLSLRKKKLEQYISEKRKKYIKEINNIDENGININIEEIIKKIPNLLVEEFDIYEDKLAVCHQFLNNDFTLLHGLDFDPDNVKLFILYKLTNLTYEENAELYEDKSEENLKLVFYDLIKIINESKSPKIFYGTTTIIVNFLFSSKKLVEEFRKINGIWKRFQELCELNNPDITDNIITIMLNAYSTNQNIGKEYILSNYSRYIKQIFINFFKTFDNESKKKNNIELDLFFNGVSLIARLITNENHEKKSSNDFDVVVKMKYLYNDLTKMFTTSVSWLINEINIEQNSLIYKFINKILNAFSAIAQYCNEETYEMNEFRDKYFVSSICSLIRIIILNKNNEIQSECALNTLYEIYDFLSLLFCLQADKTQIYCDNKIIILTEELLKKIDLNNKNLIKKIYFFLSNYAENINRCRDIFADEYLLVNIKENAYKDIYDDHFSFNLFCLIENGFDHGDHYCKELIIKNFSYFLIERIKILCDYAVKGVYKKSFDKKCMLLSSILTFLDVEKQKYSEVRTQLLNIIESCSIYDYLSNIQTNAKQINHELVAELLKELKHD